jgi:methylmalonyl-CoA mutase
VTAVQDITGKIGRPDSFAYKPVHRLSDWLVDMGTEAEWLAAAEKNAGARGVKVDLRKLLAQSARGARPIAGRPAGETWRVVERIDTGHAADAALSVAAAAAGGAGGFDFILGGSLHPSPRRLECTPNSLAAALTDVPQGSHLRVDAGAPDPAVIQPFVALAARADCELVWCFDPAAMAAVGQKIREPLESNIRSARAAFEASGIAGQALIADGRLWHAGGANEEQELGIALATYASHVRLLGGADRIGIVLAADSDQFRTIAKFRAIRLLVARVLEVGGLAARPPPVHAETSWRSMTTQDTDNNILRATAAVFGAIAGGADTVTVLPLARPGSDGPPQRLARNLQLILRDEAHIARVADPAAGSNVIEALTATFAESAWKRFQSIEAEGGILGAIAEGALLRDVAEAREVRLARVARADIRLVGVNAYRGEAAVLTVKRAPVKRTGPLQFKRLSNPFEGTP